MTQDHDTSSKTSEGKAVDSGGAYKQTDLSKKLRELACNISGLVPANRALQAAEEIERYYTGMLNWKATAEAKDAKQSSTPVPREGRTSANACFANGNIVAPAVPEGVDTAEFFRLLAAFHDVPSDGESWSPDEKSFIAHIDGLLAQQREAGRREGIFQATSATPKLPDPISCLREAMDYSSLEDVYRPLLVGYFSNAWNKRLAAPVIATRQPVSAKSTLGQQVAAAQAEVAQWTPAVRAAHGIPGRPVSALTDELDRDQMLAARSAVFNAARTGDVAGALKAIEQHALAAHKGSGIAGMCRDVIHYLAPVEPVSDDKRDAEQADLLNEVADVLMGNNWRGDLVERLRDLAATASQPKPTKESK